MNTRKWRLNFKNFLIILDSGNSSTIVTRRLVHKLSLEKYSVMQWQTQTGNITTNLKVNVDFTLPALIMMSVATCKCHMYGSAKGRYEMILCRDLLT